MNGFIAYLNDKPVGWCNADIITNYPRLVENNDIEIDKDKKIASVVCFIVDHNYRNKGIAKFLLAETCKYFKDQQFDYIEAYPRINPQNDAENYHGPQSLYESQGFKKIKELNDYVIVRKKLIE
jgi:ribosomal protein S18 acetylase RimI-like enzyme